MQHGGMLSSARTVKVQEGQQRDEYDVVGMLTGKLQLLLFCYFSFLADRPIGAQAERKGI